MKNILILFMVFAVFVSCEEPLWNEAPTDGKTPGAVQSYTVKNLSGKSIIYFETTDENTLYVLAEYNLSSGETKNVKASRYTDSLIVDGFSKEDDYEIQLFAVGKNEQKSPPITITVSPTTPTFINAFRSLTVNETFGGITVQATNPEKEALVIETLRKKGDGTWESIDRYYTSMEQVKYNVRGLKDSLQNFAVFVRDRWLNYSDTLETSLLPRTEIQVLPANISEISAATLPGSAPFHNNATTYNAKKAVDGNFGNYYLTARSSGMPQHFNLDLKVVYNLSRVVFHQRGGYYYRAISPRKLRVWGSINPNPDGSFDGWTLLGEFEVIKPSGLPMDTDTEEDVAAAEAGHNFDFEDSSIPVRYLRFQTLETWALSDYITLREFEIFGNLIN